MTIAQQVANDFKSATKTIAIPTLARKQGGEKIRTFDSIIYEFIDGSRLITTGRGASHKIIVQDE